MTEAERLTQELISELQKEEQRTGKKLIHFHGLPERPIYPYYLRELITIFSWLDEDHQSRACGALNSILEDQITELKGEKERAI